MLPKRRCRGRLTGRRHCSLWAAVLIFKNPPLAVEFVKSQISQLLLNEMDMSKLVITKQLTKTEDQYEKGNKQVRRLGRVLAPPQLALDPRPSIASPAHSRSLRVAPGDTRLPLVSFGPAAAIPGEAR